VIGFGDTDSKKWDEGKLLTYRLGGINFTRGSTITLSTETLTMGPDGSTLYGVRRDHGYNSGAVQADGAGCLNDSFAALSEMRTVDSNTPDAETMRMEGSTADGNGGSSMWGGISAFQALLVTMDKQGHDTIKLNMAYARY
jgi:hypothetical protein